MIAPRGGPTDPDEQRTAAAIGAGFAAPPRMVLVVNNDRSFLSHRCTWATAFRAGGSAVTVLAEDTGLGADIREHGFEFRPVQLGRESIGPVESARAALRILIELLRIRPQVVFLSATAAYTLGWFAALLLPRTTFVRIFGGAGRALDAIPDRSAKGLLFRFLLKVPGHLPNVRSLFQITQDHTTFVSRGLASARRSHLVPGAGVDVASWARTGEPDGPPVVLFAGRVFPEKGIYEFVELARRVRGGGDHTTRFVVAGLLDDGVSRSVTRAEMDGWVEDGLVEYWGHRSDMRAVLADAAVLVMPTRHPEGTPKILIEAGASGVPTVVSDQVGCRAVVDDGVSGFVLGLDDLDGWEAALRRLLDDPALRETMGRAAREKVTREFALEVVLPRIMSVAGVPRAGTGARAG